MTPNSFNSGQGDGNVPFPDVVKYSSHRLSWAPAIDIYETENEIIAVAEIPGVRPEDVNVSFQDNTLVIEGVKNKLVGLKGLSFFCVERVYGSFKRKFRIVSQVDKKRIDASVDNGVLTVILPKK